MENKLQNIDIEPLLAQINALILQSRELAGRVVMQRLPHIA